MLIVCELPEYISLSILYENYWFYFTFPDIYQDFYLGNQESGKCQACTFKYEFLCEQCFFLKRERPFDHFFHFPYQKDGPETLWWYPMHKPVSVGMITNVCACSRCNFVRFLIGRGVCGCTPPTRCSNLSPVRAQQSARSDGPIRFATPSQQRRPHHTCPCRQAFTSLLRPTSR